MVTIKTIEDCLLMCALFGVYSLIFGFLLESSVFKVFGAIFLGIYFIGQFSLAYYILTRD